MASNLSDILVQIDNGHGSDTPGKRSPLWPDGTQIFEWSFNRKIASMVDLGLKRYKIRTAILVPETTDVPLYLRTARSNRLTLKNKSILISIHANAGGGTGAEVWTSVGQTKSDDLATIWFNVAQSKSDKLWGMRKDMSDGDPDKEEQFWMLTKTACPAILTENGFMDNKHDCEKMLDPYYQKMIADIHVEAVLAYIGKK